MERAGRLIAKWKLRPNCVTPEQLARAAWPAAVGRRIALRTGRVLLVRSSLVVEVEDDTWRRQLFALRGQILRKLEEVLGPGIVSDVEFRLAFPRRQPQREQTPPGAAGAPGLDEADRIQDPVFRRLYRIARKRASA